MTTTGTPRFQFGRGNLMLATAFMGLAVAILVHVLNTTYFKGGALDEVLAIGASAGAAWGVLRRGRQGILRGAFAGFALTIGSLLLMAILIQIF